MSLRMHFVQKSEMLFLSANKSVSPWSDFFCIHSGRFKSKENIMKKQKLIRLKKVKKAMIHSKRKRRVSVRERRTENYCQDEYYPNTKKDISSVYEMSFMYRNDQAMTRLLHKPNASLISSLDLFSCIWIEIPHLICKMLL